MPGILKKSSFTLLSTFEGRHLQSRSVITVAVAVNSTVTLSPSPSLLNDKSVQAYFPVAKAQTNYWWQIKLFQSMHRCVATIVLVDL
ncbi:hypothetical protein CEXT_690621 [Caerostris extrusa]|uniref:Uncharacterized protein n=1 Tax=Caerostris extrusa TaxID=172846 RepID=A0AAV4SZ87_CAEEX|nr:hypothetical protein CEXT_690621 [Caerostris extrusa]